METARDDRELFVPKETADKTSGKFTWTGQAKSEGMPIVPANTHDAIGSGYFWKISPDKKHLIIGDAYGFPPTNYMKKYMDKSSLDNIPIWDKRYMSKKIIPEWLMNTQHRYSQPFMLRKDYKLTGETKDYYIYKLIND
jgi:hypothetical protein